jgi:hypothetical protein
MVNRKSVTTDSSTSKRVPLTALGPSRTTISGECNTFIVEITPHPGISVMDCIIERGVDIEVLVHLVVVVSPSKDKVIEVIS